MAQTNLKVGRMPCECCTDTVWLKQTSAGKLAYRCEGCGSGHFAEKGDKAYRKWMAAMTPHHDQEADGDSKPAPAGKAAKPAQAFSLGEL